MKQKAKKENKDKKIKENEKDIWIIKGIEKEWKGKGKHMNIYKRQEIEKFIK